jgi:hypothetical protein
MRSTVLVALAMLGLAPSGAAAELSGFFACQQIVFFGPCPKAEPVKTAGPTPPAPPAEKTAASSQVVVQPAPAPTTPPGAPRERVEESLWAEPMKGPDGQLRVYVPPKPVRDFLEKPTAENARAYLGWNQARMRKMDEAVDVLREVSARHFGTTAPAPEGPPIRGPLRVAPAPEPARRLPVLPGPGLTPSPTIPTPQRGPILVNAPSLEGATRAISVLYAFAPWCRYSRQQTPIMNRLAAHLPIRSLVFDATRDDLEMLRGALAFAVAPGTSEQRRQLGIQSYPTTFFLEGAQVLHVARGLQSAEQLVTTLATLAGRQPLPVNAVAPDETCQVKT